MKKFFALVLALVMALSLTTVAWGAGTVYEVTDSTSLTTAFTSAGSGDTIKLMNDLTIDSALATYDGDGAVANLNSKVAVKMKDGVTFDGSGYTLKFTDVVATGNEWHTAILMEGSGTVKNVVIDCASRGIVCYNAASGVTVNIDNVTIENSNRPVNVTNSNVSTLVVSDSSFAGKFSYDLGGGTATFTNCTFVNAGDALDKDSMLSPYSNTVFNNCVYEEGFVLSFEDLGAQNSAGANAIGLTDCIYDGEPLTADNMADLADNYYNAATHAVAATYTATGTTPVDTKDAKTMAVKGAMVIEMVPAKDAYVATATGNWVPGYVKHYVDEYGTTYVPCTADVEGALYLYYKGTKSVYDVVVAANPVYAATATEFTNFGTGCGQLDNRADTTVKYYTVVDGNGVKSLYQGTTATANQVMVNGKLVGVVPTDLINALNDHKWVVEKNVKNEITAAKCSLCGQAASWTLNKASIPTGAEFEAAPGGGYLYWNAAPVASEKPVVESAQTFDAGIAMYVGMSVMAAAGGAVVLKKRED